MDAKIYLHTKFRWDISFHGWYKTTFRFGKWTAAILKFYFRFEFDLIFVISVSFYIELQSFVKFQPPSVELWRHVKMANRNQFIHCLWLVLIVLHCVPKKWRQNSNHYKICCSYYDFYFGVTFFGTHCILTRCFSRHDNMCQTRCTSRHVKRKQYKQT